jgi:mannitol/fructose-specific phosphotransferase system IIA component (Ntr-type)
VIPIHEILSPDYVNLALSARDKVGAVEELLAKLTGDPKISDLEEVRHAVLARDAAPISQHGCGICIAHGRTQATSGLIMAAGRSPEGIRVPGIKEPLRLIFLAVIPAAMDSEYLRIVGAIARFCRDEKQLAKLLSTKQPDQFVEMLGTGEVKL